MIESYKKILKVVNTGEFGKIQAIIISSNSHLDKEKLKKKILDEMIIFSSLLTKPENNCVNGENKPYFHCCLLTEHKNKEIFRYTATTYSGKEQEYITLYMSKGEIRYDSISGKVMTYIQKPDYKGDEVKENCSDIKIDLDKKIVGNTTISDYTYSYYKNIIEKL